MARRIRAREVLRLRSVNGLSKNAIARTAHVSKHSVQDVLEAARERGVSWEDVEGMSEEAAYALLFPGRGDAGPAHADPDWARVHRELARTGVTLKLLHAEYVDRCTEAGAPSMSYDRLCKRYRQYTVSRNVVSRVGHKAGRNMEVDWSGSTMRLVDPATGAVRRVYLFVACLPFSRYSYVEPTLDMKQDTPGIGRTAAYPQLLHRLQRPAARKVAETRRHRVREAEAEPSVGFRPRAHRGAPSADRPSSPRPPASHTWTPGPPASGTRAIIFTGIRPSPPAWADSARLLLPAEKAAALFGNAFPVLSPRTRLRTPRGLRSSTFGSGWPESPASALSPIG